MNNHYTGRLHYDARQDAYTHLLRDESGRLIKASLPQSSKPEHRDNARRLAACWNACLGISTENLEANLPVQDLANRYNQVLRERDALAAKLAELEGQEPVGEIIHTDVLPGRDGAYRHELLCDFRLSVQTELFARPVPGKSARLTDEQIDSVHKDCETSYIPGSIVAFETFFAWGVEDAVLRANGLNDRPAGDRA